MYDSILNRNRLICRSIVKDNKSARIPVYIRQGRVRYGKATWAGSREGYSGIGLKRSSALYNIIVTPKPEAFGLTRRDNR